MKPFKQTEGLSMFYFWFLVDMSIKFYLICMLNIKILMEN